MTITPIEIRNQRFPKSIRGYNDQEVNKYLINLAEEYENLYRENVELKEKLQRCEFELGKYQGMETTLHQSLIVAQQTAEDIVANAHKEAEMTLRAARERILEIFSLYEDILKRLTVFKAEMKAFLLSQMELMEQDEKKIEKVAEFFYSRDMKEILDKLAQAKEEGARENS